MTSGPLNHCPRRMVEQKRPYTFDYRMIAADGRTVWNPGKRGGPAR